MYPHLLTSLLKKAEDAFEQILTLPKKDLTFKKVVEDYFNNDRALTVLYSFLESYNGTNNTPLTRKIVEAFEPKMVDYYNKTMLHKGYYKLLKSIARKRLTPDQKRSVFLLLKNMKMSGVDLPDNKRKMIEKINKELSKLSQKFENNTIDSRKQFFYEFNDESVLREMPPSELSLAAMEARNRKSKARYVFTLSPPSLQALLKYCSDRSIRELFYKKALTVASEGKYDNRPLILTMLQLRQQKAQLLGFKNYADYILQARMARSIRQIEILLNKISQKALAKSHHEIQELARFAGLKELNDWDITYYSEKLKQQRFAIEEKELKKFFPLDHIMKGLFTFVSRLFGIEMRPLRRESYFPDLQIFEVWKKNELLAYYIADFSARPSKKGGAWCNHIRPAYFSDSEPYQVPIIINVMNFPPQNGTEPPLLSHRDVETLFHEFGHALHLLFSSKTYTNLHGFNTEWDFVEFPSQLLENWCWESPSLRLFAKHYRTKKVLPEAMIRKLRATKTFMAGYKTLRQLEFAFLDLKLHTHQPPKSLSQLDNFCEKTVQQYSVLRKFKGYKMYTSFDHIFAGGYAAGYYSYMWAEILEADVFLTMKKNNIVDPAMGRQYLEKVLIPGAKKDGSELFKDFMGRNPDVRAFIEKHALV